MPSTETNDNLLPSSSTLEGNMILYVTFAHFKYTITKQAQWDEAQANLSNLSSVTTVFSPNKSALLSSTD